MESTEIDWRGEGGYYAERSGFVSVGFRFFRRRRSDRWPRGRRWMSLIGTVVMETYMCEGRTTISVDA